MTDDISKVVPPVHAATFVPSFSEAARCLGMAQAQGKRLAIEHWQGIVDAHEAAAKAALRLESATTPATTNSGEIGSKSVDAAAPVGVDGAALKARENLRQVVEASVAKSGSGAVLVSACTVADLFADYATLARQLTSVTESRDMAKAIIDALAAEMKAAGVELIDYKVVNTRADELARQLAESESALAEAMIDAERLREIAQLIGCIFAYGGFKAETFNERRLEVLLRENGTFWQSASEYEAANAAIYARLASDSATGEGEKNGKE